MKVAIIFFGISYLENYVKRTKSGDKPPYNIDYRKSLDNYQKYIFEYFKDDQIDIFLATNPSKYSNKLLADYQPKRHVFLDNLKDQFLSRNKKIIEGVKLCLEYSQKNAIEYDVVLITRFDLCFMKDFKDSKIDLTKINVVSRLKDKRQICDNFYLLPFQKLKYFLEVLVKHQDIQHHNLRPFLENISFINYILDERTSIPSLSFYKLARFELEY